MPRTNPFYRSLWKRNKLPDASPEVMRNGDVPMDRNPPNMTRLPLRQRLKIIEDFVACHPGRPVTTILLDLFPELLQLDRD